MKKTCDILDDMAQKGFIDSTISNKIREFFQHNLRHYKKNCDIITDKSNISQFFMLA